VQSASGEDAKVDVNFQEVVAKQGAAAQEQVKKAEEAKSKMEGLKAHFDAGNALIDQEKQAKADLQKAPPDQRDALSRSWRLFRIRQSRNSRKLQESWREGPNAHLVWFKLGEAYDTAAAMTTLLRPISRLSPPSRTFPAITNNMGNVLARAGKIEEAKAAYTKSAELDPPNAAPRGAILASACTTQIALQTRSSRCGRPRNLIRKARSLVPAGRLPLDEDDDEEGR